MSEALIAAPPDPTGQAPVPGKAPDMPAPAAAPEPTVENTPTPEGLNYSAAPDIKQYTGEETAKSGETADLQHTTKWDAIKSAFNLGATTEGLSLAPGSGGGTWYRQFDEATSAQADEAQGADKLDAATARDKYPGIPIDGPQYEDILKSRYQQKQYTDFLQRQIEMGPELGPLSNLGVGLAAGATNPLNYIMGAASGMLFKVAKIAPTLGKIYLSNVAMGLPAFGTVPQLQKEGRTEITYQGMVPSILEGAAIGTAIHFGLEKFSESVAKAKERLDAKTKAQELLLKSLPGDTRDKMAAQVLAQAETGSKLDVSAPLEEARMRWAGSVKEGANDPYNFTPMLEAAPDGRPMFAVTDAKDGTAGTFGHNVADNAVHLTDREQAAANVGDRHTVQVDPSTRTVDLDTLLTDESPSGKLLGKVIGDVVGEKLDVSNATTFKELLEDIKSYQEAGHLPEDTLAKIQEKLQEAGVDGYRWMHMNDGEAAHNMMAIFDDSKAKSVGYTPYDESIVPTRNMSDVAASILDPEQSVASSPKVDEQIRAAKAAENVPDTENMQKLKQGEAQSVAQIKRIQEGLKPPATEGTSVEISPEQQRLNDFIEKTVAGIEDDYGKEMKDNKELKRMADCVIAGLV